MKICTPFLSVDSLAHKHLKRTARAGNGNGLGTLDQRNGSDSAGFSRHHPTGVSGQNGFKITVWLAFQHYADTSIKASGAGFGTKVISDADEIGDAITGEILHDPVENGGELSHAWEWLELEVDVSRSIQTIEEDAACQFGRFQAAHGGEYFGVENFLNTGICVIEKCSKP